MVEIRPQPGPQEKFLSSRADICIYGGSAGGGKSWGLLLEPLRHIHNKDFRAVIFRRTCPEITNPGGLWEESCKLYYQLGADSYESTLEWEFESGAMLKFAHMQHEKDKHSWQGSQIPFIGFDELTHFSKAQFMYMLSRNRSMCGIRPYIRATTNPDADSWVAEFIAWWINQDTGYAIPERSGVLRWFVRDGDNIIWANSPEELHEKYPDIPIQEILSVTFIPASVYDNKLLLEKDPGYLAKLKSLSRVDRERLLGGNWKVRPSAGLYFKRIHWEIIEAVPADLEWLRYWDRAATEKKEDNDPDWTAGVKMARAINGLFFISHVEKFRESPLNVEKGIKNIASMDGQNCPIYLQRDPGQAGKMEVQHLIRQLVGYMAYADEISGDKITRAKPYSSQQEAGNIKLLRGPWNESFIEEHEAFPEVKHDDQVDAASGAFNLLAKEIKIAPPVGFEQDSHWNFS